MSELPGYLTDPIRTSGDGGFAIPVEFAAEYAELAFLPSVFASIPSRPLPPLTRRQRIRGRWHRVRDHWSLVWDAVRGRHRCPEYDD